jgi:hypothetical protein
MATEKQRITARKNKNIRKADAGAQARKSIASMPKETRSALSKQGAAVAHRRRAGFPTPRTKQELDEEAKERDLPGRSMMDRDELARPLRKG